MWNPFKAIANVAKAAASAVVRNGSEIVKVAGVGAFAIPGVGGIVAKLIGGVSGMLGSVASGAQDVSAQATSSAGRIADTAAMAEATAGGLPTVRVGGTTVPSWLVPAVLVGGVFMLFRRRS